MVLNKIKLFGATVTSLYLLASAYTGGHQTRLESGFYAPLPASSKQAQTITITRNGSQPYSKGSAQYFTGSVRINPLIQATPPSRTSGGSVTFEPGARSAWHTHPLSQILIVTAGTGWVQQEGSEKQEIKPGDIIWTSPGVKHWHGATATTAMTHIAIQEEVDGKNVDWMKQVSEKDYKMAMLKSDAVSPVPTPDDVRMVAPALERYTESTIGDLWKRPGLSARDRSLITVAVLIGGIRRPSCRHISTERSIMALKRARFPRSSRISRFTPVGRMRCRRLRSPKMYFARVESAPISFLRPKVRFFPLTRRPRVGARPSSSKVSAAVAPGVVQYTSDLLFHDLWLRPALAPRDRSLITVSALIASCQVAQISAHLNRAMDNGLTKSEASEALTHLLFYAGCRTFFPQSRSPKSCLRNVPDRMPNPMLAISVWRSAHRWQSRVLRIGV